MLMSDDVNNNGGDVHAWGVDEWCSQQQWWRWCPCLRWLPPCSCCSVCSGNPRSCQIAPLTLPADITLGETLWYFVRPHPIPCWYLWHWMTLCGILCHLMTLCVPWWHALHSLTLCVTTCHLTYLEAGHILLHTGQACHDSWARLHFHLKNFILKKKLKSMASPYFNLQIWPWRKNWNKRLHLAGGEVLLPHVNLHFRLHLVNIARVQFCLPNNLVWKEQIETWDWLCADNVVWAQFFSQII